MKFIPQTKHIFILFIALFLSIHLDAQTSISSTEIFSSNWETESFGEPAMQLLNAVEFEKMELVVDEAVRPYIEKIDNYIFETTEQVVMSINTIRYNPFMQADLQGAADGALKDMKRQGIENIQFEENDFPIGKVGGLQQRGTFQQFGKVFRFSNNIFCAENTLWQIMIAYPEEDDFAENVMDKMLGSLSFEL